MSSYLYETTAMLADGSTVVPIRLAYGRGFNAPDAPGYFAPVLVAEGDSINTNQQVYAQRLGFGLGTRDAANIRGVASAEYDFMLTAGFGREATLRFAPDENDYSTSFIVARGVAANAQVQQEYFDIGWYDDSARFDVPLSDGLFAGTNSGTTGLEGLPADIKGRRKPRSWGRPRNIEPVLLNSSLRTYGWNYTRNGTRAASISVEAVRVRGSLWTPTTDYADATALNAASITVGEYGTCLAESLIRMGGSGSVDGNVRIDVTVTNDTVVEIAHALLVDSGVASGDIDATDYAAAVAYADFEAQLYITDETTYRAAINDLLSSALVWLFADRGYKYRFGYFPTSISTPAFTVKKFGVLTPAGDADFNIIDINLDADSSTKNIPSDRVTVRYYQQEPLSLDGIAAAVSAEDKAKLSAEWRTAATVTNSTITAIYPNAQETTLDTLLINESDANTTATRLLAIVGKNLPNFTVTVAATSNLPEIGDTVKLMYPRFLEGQAVLCVVAGVRFNVRASTAELRLWSIEYD